MADLTDEERTRYRAYRRELRQTRLADVRAYHRARYRRVMDATDSAGRERLRARWRAQNQRRAATQAAHQQEQPDA